MDPLSLANATLTIPRAHMRKGAKGTEVVFYELRSSRLVGLIDSTQKVTDVAFKRFSDFVALDQKLRKNYVELELPALPPKKIFGNLEPKFVEQRRQQLEAYLIALVQHDGTKSSSNTTGSTATSNGIPTLLQQQLSSASLFNQSLIQTSQDLRAFVPAGFLKSPPTDLLHFEVIEVNTFGLNRQLQLTAEPKPDGVLCFRDGSGSGGLDSQQNKFMIGISEILSVVEQEGSHLRAIITYITEEQKSAAANTSTTLQKGSSSASSSSRSQQQPTPSSYSSTPAVASSMISSNSISSIANSRLNLSTASGDWSDETTVEPLSSPTSASQQSNNPSPPSSLSSSGAAAAALLARAKKKTLEFAAFEDRMRFVRMIKHFQQQAKENGTSVNNALSPSPSPSSAGVVTPATSPNSLALYPTPTPTQAWCSIFTSTWNQAKEPEPEDLSGWLPKGGGSFDILAIGVQESPLSVNELSEALAKHLGSGYYIVGRKGLWEIKLVVFARVELALGTVIHRVETDSVATGIMGIMGNKGGVAVSFRIGNMSLAFVNTHLAPHMERYQDRNKMFEEIDASLKVGLQDLDLSLKFDQVFWLGDLNYRIEIPYQHVYDLAMTRQFDLLFPKDQLRRAQWSQEGFTGYSEGALTFPPTYKYTMPKKNKNKSVSNASPVQQKPSTPTPTGANTNSTSNTPATPANPTAATSGAAAAAAAPLPSVTEEEEEAGQSLKPPPTLLSKSIDEQELTVNPALAHFAALNITPTDLQMRSNSTASDAVIRRDDDDESSAEEDEEEHSEGEEGEDDDGELDEDELDGETEADDLLSTNLTSNTSVLNATTATTTSSSPTLSSSLPGRQSQLDMADAALFDSLDPDFHSYSRQRVRADHSTGSQYPGSSSSTASGLAAAPASAASSISSDVIVTSGYNRALPPLPPKLKPHSSAPSSPPTEHQVPPPPPPWPPVTATPIPPVTPATTTTASTNGAVSETPAPPTSTTPTSVSKNRRAVSMLTGDSSSTAFISAALDLPAPVASVASDGTTSSATATVTTDVPLLQKPTPPPLPRKSLLRGDNRRRSATVPGAPKRKVFSRTYGKKRIPSWCDRILFRSRQGGLGADQIKLKGYYRCDTVATSDHLPVCAIFDLKIPLPPPIPAYSYPASIILSGLSLDLTVHPMKLGRHNLDFLDKIYVAFYGPFLAETSRGKRTGYATLKNPDGSVRPSFKETLPLPPSANGGDDDGPDLRPLVILAHWTELEIPVLQSVLGSEEFIALESIYYVVKSGDELAGGADLVLGQGQINLSSLTEFFPTRDESTVPPPPAHISTLALQASANPNAPKPLSPNPFPPSISEGQDGSVGITTTVRVPNPPTMYKPPTIGTLKNSWKFCSLIERHSAAIGTLNATIFVSIERPEVEQPKKSEEQLIAEVLSAE